MPAHRHLLVANITGNALGNLTSTNRIRRGGHQELTTNDREDYHLGGAGTADATVGQSSSVGGGGGHSHGHSLTGSSSFSGNAINLAVQYVDFIIVQKD